MESTLKKRISTRCQKKAGSVSLGCLRVLRRFQDPLFEVVKKHERHSGRRDLFFEENFNAEGVPPLLAPEGGSGFAEARPTLP